jgi:hypothetical protein
VPAAMSAPGWLENAFWKHDATTVAQSTLLLPKAMKLQTIEESLRDALTGQTIVEVEIHGVGFPFINCESARLWI